MDNMPIRGSGSNAGRATQTAAPTAANNTANALEISPVRTDLSIAPGKSANVTMKVTNMTKAPMIVRPVENDFIAGDEKGTPALILDADKYAPTHSLKRFMTPLKDVTIQPGKIQDITLTINVPKDAKAGGYYGAVRFVSVTPDGGEVNLSLNTSAASLVLLTVPGDLVEQLDITNFDIKQNGSAVSGILTKPDGISLTLRTENKGNVQSGLFGQIYVKDGDKVLYSHDFNQATPRAMVLPDSARSWDIPLDKVGKFGKYTIGATLSYGTKNKSVEISKTIWVIPTWAIIAAIAAIVLIVVSIVGLIVFIRRRRSHAHKSHGRGGVKFRR